MFPAIVCDVDCENDAYVVLLLRLRAVESETSANTEPTNLKP